MSSVRQLAEFAVQYSGHRGVAQLVARTAGGREVAGSSPVTPTNPLQSKRTAFAVLFLPKLPLLVYPTHSAD
jgi:hypothetical protein